jgi:hypothetical protein
VNDQETPDLGQEILNCRRLPGAKAVRAEGLPFGEVWFYALIPFLILPGLCLLITALLSGMVLAIRGSVPDFAVMGLVFGCLYAGSLYLMFVLPRDDHLILYEKGLRVRRLFKPRCFTFDQIDTIFPGRTPSRFETGLRSVLVIFKPGQVALMRSSDWSALTVRLTDGTAVVFGGVMARYEPQDLERLFEEFARQTSHADPEAAAANAPAAAGTPAAPAGSRSASVPPWPVVLGVLFVGLVVWLYFSGENPAGGGERTAWRETFTVNPGAPKIHPVGLKKGELLSVKVSVRKGGPVSVQIGRSSTRLEGNMLIIPNAGLPEAESVRNYTLDWRPWSHDDTAVIMVLSEDRSEVTAEVKVKPE